MAILSAFAWKVCFRQPPQGVAAADSQLKGAGTELHLSDRCRCGCGQRIKTCLADVGSTFSGLTKRSINCTFFPPSEGFTAVIRERTSL